jgi:hypothetical protein
MNMKRLFVAALFAGTAFAANAADSTSITECLDLGPDQEIIRSVGPDSFLLRDGDAHYRVKFRGSCGSLATASRISIVSDGTADRLCPQNTKVKTSRDICRVGKVEVIDAEEFASVKKRASR